jgi:hypothetical protein
MFAPRLRSRRLALVAAVLVLGAAACGSDDDSGAASSMAPVTVAAPAATSPAETVPADRPPVIRIGEASGGIAPESAAAEDAVASDADASTKIMAAGIQFVFDGAAGDLTGPAPAWFFPNEGLPSAEEVQTLAAQFGLEGEVVEVAEDRGGGLAVGSLEDYTEPSLMVAPDAMQSWWYNAGDRAMEQPECEPVRPTDGSETEEVVCEPLPPPANVPTREQAELKAAELLTRLGLDPSSYEFETYADEWNASVNALLLVDGVRTNVAMYMSYGAEGALTWAGGFLATPQKGEEYPRIGVPAAIERLNAPSWMLKGETVRDIVDTATEEGATSQGDSGEAAPATDIDGAGPDGEDVPAETRPVELVDPAVCDPAADCVPADQEPIVVRLSNPRPSLEQLWAEDGTVWLLPGYAFDGDDAGTYTVIAVDAAYLAGPEQPATAPAVDPVSTDTAPTPDTVAPDSKPTYDTKPTDDTTGPSDSTVDSPDTTTDVTAPDALIGLTLEEAAPVVAQAGFELRVVREDGVDLVVTEDFRENRLNVAVEDGIITELVSIG